MGLLGNILVTFALMLWPMVLVVSVMGMGGPGASNNMSWMFQLMMFNSYPIWIFAVLSYTGSTFWGVSSNYFLIGVSVVFLVFNAGFIYSIFNLMRGINNEGYSVAGGQVYWNANLMSEADSGTFQPILKKLAIDQNHFYDSGRVLDIVADPASFRHIEELYYRDNEHIFYVPYYEVRLVEEAEVESFEVITETNNDVTSDARDAHFRYYSGEKVAPR